MSDRRIESMIFNYETTVRTDYRDGEILPLTPRTKYKGRRTRPRPCPTPLKDYHTLSEWKVPYNIPFTLFWKETNITRMNPLAKQTPHFQPIDHEREEVQRTRPRVSITPAVKVDDTDTREYQLLVKETYKSTYMQVTKELGDQLAQSQNVVAPLPAKFSRSNPMSLPKYKAPYVSPEWRMRSVPSDGLAYRTSGDTTRDFWLNRKRSPCMKCDESTAVTAQRKMRQMMLKR